MCYNNNRKGKRKTVLAERRMIYVLEMALWT